MRRLLLASAALAAVLAVAAPAASNFPDVIPLPDGFRPEGIASGRQTTFYVGSIPTGAIFRGDVKTGAGAVFVEGAPGRAAIGVEYDRRGDRLFVAGGPTGDGFVYDAARGALVRAYQLVADADPTFVNDVFVTRDAAWFTDSRRPVLHRVDLADGTLGAAQAVPVTGDYAHVPNANNLNGIEATADGDTLVVVQSATGKLFTVEAATGVASEIDLGGESMTNGDGLLLQGRTLYVVQNRLNQVAVVELADDLSSGTVVERLTDPDFDVPTTIARFGGRFYLPNARFTTPPTPETEYAVVQLRR